MTYDCMTPEEYEFWQQGARNEARANGWGVTKKPCNDCPAWFRQKAKAEGTCIYAEPRTYTDDQRAYKRDWMRAYRERQRAA